MKAICFLLAMSCFSGFASGKPFVRVSEGRFLLGDQPYFVTGTNFWQGMNLGSPASGDQALLKRELDLMKRSGINQVRVMASSEGDGSISGRIKPALMYAPGLYNEDVFKGLDFLLAELDKRNMRAVMVLNNFWEWSGGMAQYVSWADERLHGAAIEESQGYPAERFYNDSSIRNLCRHWYFGHIRRVLSRVNHYNGKVYKSDPAIFAWQLANEPRSYPLSWINKTAQYIRSLDANHLITTGSEGRIGGPFVETHQFPSIDYATFHIWVQNWGEYDPADSSRENFAGAKNFALSYMEEHERIAREILQKPVVLEEYGIARDGWTDISMYSPDAPVSNRDKYFGAILTKSLDLMENQTFAGQYFWAWSGEGRPGEDGWTGDPPHEPQGWYSVYNTDQTTLELFRSHAEQVHQNFR